MAFWKFGFHSQSAIDTILSSSAANQHHPHPNVNCSTPSFPNLPMLDKLLDEDDLLQEVKAQHPKLVEFLGTREVVARLLGYVSGIIFDDEEADRMAENSNSNLNRLSSVDPSNSPAQSQSSLPPIGYGGALLHSLRSTRVVGDTIGALLMDALDSEGRTPEDRAKAERRKIRYPYLSAEVIASDLWTVTTQIFSDPPRLQLLTQFWDAVLDQSPTATAAKSVQIGYWAKANIALINSKPNEMVAFIKSYPNQIPKLLAHFNSSPVVDVLMRIIQSEQTCEGVIDWLVDSTDFVEIVISLFHPSRKPELHRAVADFLKDVIAFCTNQVASNITPLNLPTKPGSPPASESSNTFPSSPDLVRPNPNSTAPPARSSGSSDESPKFITSRLMRELSSSSVISKLLSFGLDAPYSEDDDVITSSTLSSSLINSLSVIIDLIRRNNSDFSEHQLMVYLRDYPPPEREESENQTQLSYHAPRVVPLIGLLNAIGDRLGDLQALIHSPRSSTKPRPLVAGLIIPLTQERFRIVELYAELLHCSNMALVNRLSSEQGPRYDNDGALISDLESLFSIFCVNDDSVDLLDTNSPYDLTNLDPSQALHEIQPDSTSTNLSNEKIVDTILNDGNQGDAVFKEEIADNSLSPDSKEPSTSSPSPSSLLLSSDEIPAGVRMKELFLEHKILDSCLDLFFQFPWNNFLHNVIYDLVQQTLNAKFSNFISGQASLKLTKSFFNETKVIERLIDGLDANLQYQSKSKNGRLGNMGHLVLIADEVLKVIETNSQEFSEVIAKIKTNERWQEFVKTQIFEAREHAKLPLGGVMPVISSTIESQVIPAQIDATFPSVSITNDNNTIEVMTAGKSKKKHSKNQKKGEEFARYLVEQISATTMGADENSSSSSSSSSDGEEDEGSAEGKQGQTKSDHISNDDQWDSTRFSDPQPFSGDNQTTRDRIMSGSIISNPTPFDFDDRFHASIRTFPQRFADSDQNGDYLNGFDDDFGSTELEEKKEIAQVTSNGTPKPKKLLGSKGIVVEEEKKPAGDENQEEEEEWGEFSSSENASELMTRNDSSIALGDKIGTADDEASWNDFDLLVDQSPSSNNKNKDNRHLLKPELVDNNLLDDCQLSSDPHPTSQNDITLNP